MNKKYCYPSNFLALKFLQILIGSVDFFFFRTFFFFEYAKQRKRKYISKINKIINNIYFFAHRFFDDKIKLFCHISFGAKETWRKENMCDEIFLNLLSQSLDRIFILLEKASVTRGINPTQTDTCNLKTVRSWSKFKKFHMHGFNYTLIFKLFS